MIAGSTTAEPNIRTTSKSIDSMSTGGSVEIRSGAFQETSSPEISIPMAYMGVAGVSGQLRLETDKDTEGMMYSRNIRHWFYFGLCILGLLTIFGGIPWMGRILPSFWLVMLKFL